MNVEYERLIKGSWLRFKQHDTTPFDMIVRICFALSPCPKSEWPREELIVKSVTQAHFARYPIPKRPLLGILEDLAPDDVVTLLEQLNHLRLQRLASHLTEVQVEFIECVVTVCRLMMARRGRFLSVSGAQLPLTPQAEWVSSQVAEILNGAGAGAVKDAIVQLSSMPADAALDYALLRARGIVSTSRMVQLVGTVNEEVERDDKPYISGSGDDKVIAEAATKGQVLTSATTGVVHAVSEFSVTQLAVDAGGRTSEARYVAKVISGNEWTVHNRHLYNSDTGRPSPVVTGYQFSFQVDPQVSSQAGTPRYTVEERGRRAHLTIEWPSIVRPLKFEIVNRIWDARSVNRRWDGVMGVYTLEWRFMRQQWRA